MPKRSMHVRRVAELVGLDADQARLDARHEALQVGDVEAGCAPRCLTTSGASRATKAPWRPSCISNDRALALVHRHRAGPGDRLAEQLARRFCS
jgi:hypothetical protein